MADTPHWGSLPDRTSYLFDAMLRLAYFLGNYYPKGSSQKFADDLGRGLTARGGSILKCASVEKILIENGKAEGVRISTVSKRAPERLRIPRARGHLERRRRAYLRDSDRRGTLRALADRASEIAQAELSMLPDAPRTARHGSRRACRRRGLLLDVARSGRRDPHGFQGFHPDALRLRDRAAGMPDSDRAEAYAGTPRGCDGLAGAQEVDRRPDHVAAAADSTRTSMRTLSSSSAPAR